MSELKAIDEIRDFVEKQDWEQFLETKILGISRKSKPEAKPEAKPETEPETEPPHWWP